MFRLIALCFFMLCSCVSVRKADWVKCWDICGKGDRLDAVSGNECVCKNGSTHPYKEDEPSQSIFDMVGAGQPN